MPACGFHGGWRFWNSKPLGIFSGMAMRVSCHADSGLVRLIRLTRQERPEATVRNELGTSVARAAALMANDRFHHKLNGHDLFMYAFRSKTQQFLMLDADGCDDDKMAVTSSLVPEALAKAVAEEFGKFINA